MPYSAQQLRFPESWTAGVYPKPCKYCRLSPRRSPGGEGRAGGFLPGEAVVKRGLLASLAHFFPAGCPTLLLDPTVSVSQPAGEGPCSWLSTGRGRQWVLLSGEIPNGVQLPGCALLSDRERDPQAGTCHPHCVAASPFPGTSVDLFSRVRGRFPPTAF